VTWIRLVSNPKVKRTQNGYTPNKARPKKYQEMFFRQNIYTHKQREGGVPVKVIPSQVKSKEVK
jgi:hypothetical protein